MDIKNWTRKISKGFYSTIEAVAWIGYISVVCILLFVFIDVCGRYFLSRPLPGSYELVEQSMVVLAGSTIMYAAVKRGHVAVDIITRRFSRRARAILQCIFSLSGSGISFVLAYQIFLYMGDHLRPYPESTSVLHIGTAPFTIILAVQLFLSGLILLVHTFYPCVPEETVGKKEEGVNEP